MFNQWCTIESDPGVFTELIAKLGVNDVQVEEVYSMEDDELMTKIKPEIYGFIFLFKWTKNLEEREPLTMYDEDLFFARQMVNNACATQALLSILLNSPLQIQSPLKQFSDFSKFLPSQDRGIALSNSEQIRVIHNSFSRPEPFIFKKSKKIDKKADVFHFISYVPFKGHLYELDGLQAGPILIGQYKNKQEWIELAKTEIQNRILKYSQKQILFNLLAVCEDLRKKKLNENKQLAKQKASILKKLESLNQEIDKQFLQSHLQIPQHQSNDIGQLNGRLNEIAMTIEDNQLFCEEQLRKAEQRKQQNIRRKHNYIPLIIQMMKTLAKKDLLNEIVDKAVEKKKQKAEQKKQTK